MNVQRQEHCQACPAILTSLAYAFYYFVIFLVFCLLSGCRPQIQTAPEELLGNILAQDLIDPMTRSALTYQMELVKQSPGKPQSWGALGILLKESDFAEEAGACFSQAAKLDPNNPKWVYLVGWSQLPAFPEKAIEPLKRAAILAKSRDPENLVALLRLAEAYQGLGLANDERAALESIPPGPPFGDFAQLRLAELDWEEGRDESFRSRVGTIPERPNWSRRLGLLKRSLTTLNSKNTENATHSEGERGAAQFGSETDNLTFQREPARAEAAWIDPYVRETRPAREGLKGAFQQAWSLEAGGQYQEAAGELEKILAFGKDSRALAGLIRCKLKALRFGEAESIIQDAKSAFPNHLQISLLEGELALAKGIAQAQVQQWPRAREIWQDALETFEPKPSNWSARSLQESLSDSSPSSGQKSLPGSAPSAGQEEILLLKCRLAFWLDDKPLLLACSTRLLQRNPGLLGARVFAAWARQDRLLARDLDFQSKPLGQELAEPSPSGREPLHEAAFPETAAILRRMTFP